MTVQAYRAQVSSELLLQRNTVQRDTQRKIATYDAMLCVETAPHNGDIRGKVNDWQPRPRLFHSIGRNRTALAWNQNLVRILDGQLTYFQTRACVYHGYKVINTTNNEVVCRDPFKGEFIFASSQTAQAFRDDCNLYLFTQYGVGSIYSELPIN